MAVTKFCPRRKISWHMFPQGPLLLIFFFVCLIKTGNALKLLKKYLGSIWRSPGAEGKTFPAGTAGVRLKGEVYLPRLRCRLKINYKSAWLMIVNRLTLPALSLLASFPHLHPCHFHRRCPCKVVRHLPSSNKYSKLHIHRLAQASLHKWVHILSQVLP